MFVGLNRFLGVLGCGVGTYKPNDFSPWWLCISVFINEEPSEMFKKHPYLCDKLFVLLTGRTKMKYEGARVGQKLLLRTGYNPDYSPDFCAGTLKPILKDNRSGDHHALTAWHCIDLPPEDKGISEVPQQSPVVTERDHESELTSVAEYFGSEFTRLKGNLTPS